MRTVVGLIGTRGNTGMIDASITDSPSRPTTLPSRSTTDAGSSGSPIRQVPLGWL